MLDNHPSLFTLTQKSWKLLNLIKITKAAPQDCRLQMQDAVQEMKKAVQDINNQKRQFEIVDR